MANAFPECASDDPVEVYKNRFFYYYSTDKKNPDYISSLDDRYG
jgi:hypothetical protein